MNSVSFVPESRDEPDAANRSGARWRNRRTLRTAALGRNVSGESFVADRRINERSRRGGEEREADRAGRATLFVLVGLRRVMIAIVSHRFRFHLRAAARLFRLGNRSLARDRSESDGAGKEQAKQESQHCSHHGLVYHQAHTGINLGWKCRLRRSTASTQLRTTSLFSQKKNR